MHIVELTREFTFEAAHFLPQVPDGHKCARLHGHSYRVIITVSGTVAQDGMLIDYGTIKAAAAPVIAELDHQTLNDIIPNPTSENLAVWLWGEIGYLQYLSAVTICETAATSCTYRGPESAVTA